MKAANIILNILTVICCVFIACVIFLSAPKLAGYKIMAVTSDEMAPDYSKGMLAYYKPAEFENILSSDIIALIDKRDNSVIFRRIVSKNELEETFITIANKNPAPDPVPVNYQDVLGKLSKYRLPYMGYFLSFAKNSGVILIVGIIILVKVAFSGSKRAKE